MVQFEAPKRTKIIARPNNVDCLINESRGATYLGTQSRQSLRSPLRRLFVGFHFWSGIRCRKRRSRRELKCPWKHVNTLTAIYYLIILLKGYPKALQLQENRSQLFLGRFKKRQFQGNENLILLPRPAVINWLLTDPHGVLIMDDPKSRDEELNELVKAWHEYGAQFSVFVPQQQPAPTVWDPEVEEFDERDRTDPNYLKHWKFLARTKEFVRERYAKHKILQGPALVFDCLVRKFQPRIFNKSCEGPDGNPIYCEVQDSHEWYEQAIRMDIWEWQVGFACRSNLCEPIGVC